MTTKKTELKALDVAKLIAAIMIIVLHTSPLGSFSELADKCLIGLCRVAVPFFFTASSYFFWQGYTEQTARNAMRDKLGRYCLRMVKYGRSIRRWRLWYCVRRSILASCAHCCLMALA